MDKIKTTHVGSLPRSNELSELLFKKDKKEKIDLIKFDEIVKKDVEKIVKKQIELGIDIISDGEMSKISYATYVKDRIDGFSGESERRAPKDLDDFPSFKERIARTGGTPTYTRPCCTNELKVKDTTSLAKDIKNFKDALRANNHKEAFMNAASPGVISAFLPNKFYKNGYNISFVTDKRMYEFLSKKKNSRIILMTTKAKKNYNNFKFKPKDTLLFGRESEGVPSVVHKNSYERLKIPLKKNSRSLNIGMAVAITLTEACLLYTSPSPRDRG